MAITWADGFETEQAMEFRSIPESVRRSINYLQGIVGYANPLETYITFPTGIYSIVLTNGGSGYLNPPIVAIHAHGSTGGSGATATSTVEPINLPITDGSVTGLTLTANGSGYVKILAGINQELTSPGVIITGVDTRFTFTDDDIDMSTNCLLYTSPSPRDGLLSRMPSSA